MHTTRYDINLPDDDTNANVGTFDLHYDQQLSKEEALGVSFFTPFVGFPHDKNIGSCNAMDYNNDAAATQWTSTMTR